jgi:hypothetical protein
LLDLDSEAICVLVEQDHPTADAGVIRSHRPSADVASQAPRGRSGAR